MKKYTYSLLFIFTVIFFPHLGHADIKVLQVESNNINTLVEDKVKEHFHYSGLANFYNGITVYIFDERGIKRLRGSLQLSCI